MLSYALIRETIIVLSLLEKETWLGKKRLNKIMLVWGDRYTNINSNVYRRKKTAGGERGGEGELAFFIDYGFAVMCAKWSTNKLQLQQLFRNLRNQNTFLTDDKPTGQYKQGQAYPTQDKRSKWSSRHYLRLFMFLSFETQRSKFSVDKTSEHLCFNLI